MPCEMKESQRIDADVIKGLLPMNIPQEERTHLSVWFERVLGFVRGMRILQKLPFADPHQLSGFYEFIQSVFDPNSTGTEYIESISIKLGNGEKRTYTRGTDQTGRKSPNYNAIVVWLIQDIFDEWWREWKDHPIWGDRLAVVQNTTGDRERSLSKPKYTHYDIAAMRLIIDEVRPYVENDRSAHKVVGDIYTSLQLKLENRYTDNEDPANFVRSQLSKYEGQEFQTQYAELQRLKAGYQAL
jgi:hypothetical protein